MRIKIGDKKIFSNSIKILLDVDVNIERLNAITFDSRNVKKGDIFIALSGENSDGHNFIKECLDRGASLIINEKIKANNIVKVKSSKKTFFRTRPKSILSRHLPPPWPPKIDFLCF